MILKDMKNIDLSDYQKYGEYKGLKGKVIEKLVDKGFINEDNSFNGNAELSDNAKKFIEKNPKIELFIEKLQIIASKEH